MVEAYLEYLRNVRSLSDHTVDSYRRDMNLFTRFLCFGSAENTRAADEISSSAAEEALAAAEECDARLFIAELTQLKYSPASVNRALSAVRGFYHYARRYRGWTKNPAAAVRSIKDGQKLPRFLFDRDARALCAEPTRERILWPARDAALFSAMYSSGCRVSEIASLRTVDIRGDFLSAIVMGKGKKERRVFFSADASRALKAYAAERKARMTAEREKGFFFVSKQNNPLSARGIQYIFSRYTELNRPSAAVSPHGLRHSFATTLISQGADVRVVQELLGHENISTTQRYTHVTTRRMIETYRRAHPHGSL